MSLLQWTLAWAITVIQAPVVFGVLYTLAAVVNTTFVDPYPPGSFGPGLPAIIVVIGVMGFLPMLAFGIPTAIMLERSGFTSISSYAAAGTFAGFIAGTVMVVVRGQEMVRADPELKFALIAAAYGCVAAITFRWASGPRNLTPPRDAGYQPPS